MAKIFTYKGYKIEDLQKMSLDDLVKVMPSRVRRSLKRGFNDQQKILISRIREYKKSLEKGQKPKPIETQCRDMLILPEMVGIEFGIHNGKEFSVIEIKPEMIGHYLGEFAMTRRKVTHSSPGIGATRSSLFIPIK